MLTAIGLITCDTRNREVGCECEKWSTAVWLK